MCLWEVVWADQTAIWASIMKSARGLRHLMIGCFMPSLPLRLHHHNWSTIRADSLLIQLLNWSTLEPPAFWPSPKSTSIAPSSCKIKLRILYLASSSSPSSAFINQANGLLLQEGKTEMISLMCQGHDLVGHRLGYLQQTPGQGSGS
ncbi:unnamed protein product [Musa banksii]